MSIRLSFVLQALALGGIAACASIVGLDHSDPPATTALQGSTDGGTVIGTGTLTTDAGVTIAPANIDIHVTCGETKTAPITIINTSTEAMPYQVSIPSSDSFTLDGAGDAGQLSGTIAPTSSQVVNLIGLGNSPDNDSVDVVITAGSVIQQVQATIERTGGALSITPTTLNFGQVRSQNGSGDVPVAFQNKGSDTVTITSFSNVPSQFTAPTNVTILPGTTTTANFAMPAGVPANAATTAAVTPQISGAQCGPIPTLTLAGQLVNTDVTVAPATITFDNQPCNTTPSQQENITITNYSASAVPYTVVLQAGSKFEVVPPASAMGTVPPVTTAANPTTTSIITLQPNPVGGNYGTFNETVKVTTNPNTANERVQNVAVSMIVFGAAFTVSPSYPDSTYPPINDIPYKYSNGTTGLGYIKNIGNAPVCVTYAIASGNTANFSVEPDDVFDANGGANDLEVKFTTKTCGNFMSTVVVSQVDCKNVKGSNSTANTPFCTAPAPITINGTTAGAYGCH